LQKKGRRSESIILRQFLISNITKLEKEELSVNQLHYTDWPDQGVPETTNAMTNLIRELDIWKKGLDDPIVVHCSAGIGRTGTFLAVHMALQKINSGHQLPEIEFVKKIVINLREQRLGMVQSKDQYKFVYATIMSILDDRRHGNQPKSKKKDSSLGVSFPPRTHSDDALPSHPAKLLMKKQMNLKNSHPNFYHTSYDDEEEEEEEELDIEFED